MTVTAGGEVHGAERRHTGGKPTPADPVRLIMGTGTTLATRPRRVGELVVVSDTPALPDWVWDWSRRAGRQLRVHTTPVRAPGHGPTPPGLLAAISAWAADPVLVVPTGSADNLLGQVTAALHDLPDDEPVLAAAADTVRQVGGPLVLAHALPVSFAEHSVGLRPALAHAHRVLDAAARVLAAENPDLTVETRLVRTHPHELVGENLDTGLLVIGGPRRGFTDDLGLVARAALNHATCPVLIVPR
jgi:nucleotide-binding universal stress UspA family protein